MPLIKPMSKMAQPKEAVEGPRALSTAYAMQRRAKVKKMAMGGEVSNESAHPSDLMHDEERADSIAEAIINRRKAKKMAEGGEVDLEANDEEGPSSLDELNAESVRQDVSAAPNLKENYEKEDMVSKIRKSLKARKGF